MINFENIPEDACGNYYYGEVEDYLINIENSCPQIVSLSMPDNNIYNGTSTIKASLSNGRIVATNQISGINTNVVYQAKSIELTPGFKVDKTSIFKAEIGGCSN